MSVLENMPWGMPQIIPLPLNSGTIRQWKLIEKWMYRMDTMHIFIPEGFIFDGASIPRVFTAIYAPTGYLFIAALVHDYCYQHEEYLEAFNIDNDWSYPYPMSVNRHKADAIFKKIANIEYTNHKIKTWTAYRTLRIGGWVAWNKHRKAQAND